MRCLIIQREHLQKILSGKKTWEIRGSNVRIREQIGLIESGSGLIVGTAHLVDFYGPLSPAERARNAQKTGITKPEALGHFRYRRVYAWELRHVVRLNKPVPYPHLPGAIIWVRISEKVAARIKQ